jgi:hypothetical protein
MTCYVVVKGTAEPPTQADQRRAGIVERLKGKFDALVFLQLEDPLQSGNRDTIDYMDLAGIMLAANPDHSQD